jgi:hypothetical protein
MQPRILLKSTCKLLANTVSNSIIACIALGHDRCIHVCQLSKSTGFWLFRQGLMCGLLIHAGGTAAGLAE